jgi:hypothetical protein
MPSDYELRREYVIGECVRAGKFSDARAPFWREQFDRDPAGTEQTLAALTPVLEGTPPYPRELFPQLSQRRHAHMRNGTVAATVPSPPAPAAEIADEDVSRWTTQLFPETRVAAGAGGRIVRCND